MGDQPEESTLRQQNPEGCRGALRGVGDRAGRSGTGPCSPHLQALTGSMCGCQAAMSRLRPGFLGQEQAAEEFSDTFSVP